MTTLREAAQFALEALEDIFGKNKVDVGAINALRKALAEDQSFAQLVAAERESCAMLAYNYPAPDPGGSWRESIASAIRARGMSDRHS